MATAFVSTLACALASPATAPAITIPTVSPVVTPIRGANERLLALLLRNGPLTADEQQYVDLCELEAA